MIPIFEQIGNHGEGYSYREFSERFDDICRQHLREGRAKAFAFIFYDFNSPLRRTLKDENIYRKLDRLAGHDLSIFFLNAPTSKATTSRFTHEFARALGLGADLALPCIVFFRVADGKAKDIEVGELRDHSEIAFNELMHLVEAYIKGTHSGSFSHLHVLTGAAAFVSLEVIKDLIEALVQHIVH